MATPSLAAILALAALAASPAPSPPAAPSHAPADAPVPASAPEQSAASTPRLGEAARKRVADSIRRTAERSGFRGAVLVAVGGEPVFKDGFGPRIPGSPEGSAGARPIDAGSIFEIASIAKPFTALAVMRLVEQGKLSLDDPIERFFPGAVAPETPTGTKVRHLLSHTSGYDNDSAISPYAEPSRDAAVAKFFSAERVGYPGKAFGYNNAGYCLLAAIIEAASGESFEGFMKTQIFEPAGMRSTGFPPGEGLDAAQAVRRKGEHTMLHHPWGWGYRGCGGILTTLDDLLAWDTALAAGALVSAESQALMVKPVAPVGRRRPRPESTGLGWFVSTGMAGHSRASHSGGSFGVRAMLVRYPAERILLVALSDDTADPRAVLDAAERVVLAEFPRPAAPTPPPD